MAFRSGGWFCGSVVRDADLWRTYTRAKGMRRVDATCFRINNHTRVRLDRVLARNVCARSLHIYMKTETPHTRAPLTIEEGCFCIWKGCGWIYSARTHAFETQRTTVFFAPHQNCAQVEFIQILWLSKLRDMLPSSFRTMRGRPAP